jgi:CBS domain-containing protein
MTQPPPAAPPDKDTPLDPVTARIVLRLDDAISAFRAGEGTGLPALDSASRLIGELTDDAITSAAARRGERARVPRRPDRVELAILTALADTYGSEILHNASLGYALRLIARQGGVALVQRVLWGESASDLQLATMLGATRAAFTQITLAFSDDLMADAKDALDGFRPRPPAGPNSKSSPKRGDRG